jgi:hypothetical protein
MRWALPLFIFLLTACELRHETQPSVLVIAVEGLGFESLSCDAEAVSERTFEAIRPFCEEAVRFTHAYAPSTMSQATMASLLTGLYPFDHGVRHNGSDFLSARFRTVAEAALTKNYHTYFVSGGAPIWRKSGLAQGFEIFDDAVEISPGVYYRPAEDVFRLAMNWIEHESLGSPFLAVAFLNDLLFPQVATKTKEGELRERTSEAQIEEVSEALGAFVRWLKQKRIWNSTNVVLAGLNSLAKRENETEPNTLTLKSSSVQVVLFIKPARKEKDNAIQWAVDRNVSLVDLGKTIFNWLGFDGPEASVPALEPESLVAAVSQSAPVWRENRLILSETAWPDWLENAGARTALRQNQLLLINDESPRIFNTLTDRMEVLPLKTNDPLWTSLNSQMVDLLKQGTLPPWGGMGVHWLEQIDVAKDLWRGGSGKRAVTGREAWAKWYMRKALVDGDWREVKRLAQEAGDPVGTFVAHRHLGDGIPLPRDPCVRLILGKQADKRSDRSQCGDERILALHAWQTARNDEERTGSQERFFRIYSHHLMDQDIGRLNFLNDLRWDVDRDWPERPQTLDYLLTLKELEPYSKKVSGLLSGKDLAF